jgi:hypothetical protein
MMMDCRRMVCVLLLGLAVAFAPSSSIARSRHLQQAIRETKLAIAAGQLVLPLSLIKHAKNALVYARSTLAEDHDDADVNAGMAHLMRAIKAAKGATSRRGVAVAKRHAWAALGSFETAYDFERAHDKYE